MITPFALKDQIDITSLATGLSPPALPRVALRHGVVSYRLVNAEATAQASLLPASPWYALVHSLEIAKVVVVARVPRSQASRA